MFPEYSPQLQINNQEIGTSLGKSFLFDFSTGDFIIKDGKLQIVEGADALKIWIQKILKTEKFKFKVYETGKANEYGVTLLELVNSNYPKFFIQAEIQREVAQALIKNPEIINVSDFDFTRDKKTLIVSFSVNSIYGNSVEEVML